MLIYNEYEILFEDVWLFVLVLFFMFIGDNVVIKYVL